MSRNMKDMVDKGGLTHHLDPEQNTKIQHIKSKYVLLVSGARDKRGCGAGPRFSPTPFQLFTMTIHLEHQQF